MVTHHWKLWFLVLTLVLLLLESSVAQETTEDYLREIDQLPTDTVRHTIELDEGDPVDLEIVLNHLADRFPKLERLLLRGNEKQTIPQALYRLGSLRALALEYFSDRKAPSELKKLERLRVLQFFNVPIESVPLELAELELESLNLTGTKLKTFPKVIFRMPTLYRLVCMGNDFGDLPKGWSQLPKLEIVNLNGNRIRSLPNDFTFPAIYSLDLGFNQLTEFPKPLLACPNLERLVLRDNRLTRVPRLSDKLTYMGILDLSNNKLQEIPDDFGQLDYLQALYLKGNPLQPELRQSLRSRYPKVEIDL